MQSTRYDVFISHARDDDRPARLLAEHLRAYGARVFLAIDSLTAGVAWRDAVQDALAQSRAIAVLASSNQRPGGGAAEELRIAIDSALTGQQLLVPVFLDEPTSVRDSELLRFRGVEARSDEGLRAAAERLAEALGIPATGSSDRVVSPLLPGSSPGYIDTGLTELLVSAVRLSWEQPAGPLYVVGIGGVGKTTLVAEVCRRLEPELQLVWWVRATSHSGTVGDLAALGAALHVSSEGSPEEQARDVVSYLERIEGTKWLLVFDDVWNPAEAERWIPASSAAGSTIVVSRSRPTRRLERVFTLEPLDERESVRFLRRLLEQRRYEVDPDSQDVLGELVRKSGGSPLALSLIASLIQEAPEALILESLARSEVGSHDWSLPNLIESSLLRAIRSSPEEAILLSAIAWTADTDLPTHLLLRGAQDAAGPDASFEALEAALGKLEANGLVEVSATTVVAHPLVKAAARHHVDARGIDALLGALAAALNESSEQPIAGMSALYPHFARLVGLLGKLQSPRQTDFAVSLLVRAAWSLQRSDRYTDAVELLQRTLLDSERVLGSEHPSTLSVRTGLASVYQDVGRYSEAVELLQRTLLDSERVLGPEHPSTLSLRANLAGISRAQGRYSEAIELLERTLVDAQRVLGPDHPSTLSLRADLASVYLDLGPSVEAVELLERTLVDAHRVLGPEHPSTLTVRANLASVYLDLGRNIEAVEMLARTLVDAERMLGPEHPSTLTVRANLASVYLDLGRNIEAVEMLERTLVDAERVLGPEHPSTLSMRANLAYILEAPAGR